MLHRCLSVACLALAVEGTLETQVLPAEVTPAMVRVATSVMYAALAAVALFPSARWERLLVAAVVSILVHATYLLYFVSVELTVEMSDRTQVNPECSPDSMPNNSLVFNEGNWMRAKWMVIVAGAQVASNVVLLAVLDGGEPSEKEKED